MTETPSRSASGTPSLHGLFWPCRPLRHSFGACCFGGGERLRIDESYTFFISPASGAACQRGSTPSQDYRWSWACRVPPPVPVSSGAAVRRATASSSGVEIAAVRKMRGGSIVRSPPGLAILDSLSSFRAEDDWIRSRSRTHVVKQRSGSTSPAFWNRLCTEACRRVVVVGSAWRLDSH